MPAKRNDVEEESATEREIAFTRAILGWVLVLVILFWITSPPSPTESSSVQFLIRGSLGGGDTSAQSECAEGTEIIRASLVMPQVFEVPRRMMQKAWADPKPLEMTAIFTREDGKARLTMRMVFVPAAWRDHDVQEYGGWRLARLQ